MMHGQKNIIFYEV